MIISLNGAWFCWNDGIGLEIENVTYNLGDTVTLCGTMHVVLDYSRTPVLLLEIGEVQPYDKHHNIPLRPLAGLYGVGDGGSLYLPNLRDLGR